MILNRFKIKQTDEATLFATAFPTGEVIGDYYTSDVVVSNDYYPGGMLLPRRSSNSSSYRYKFNGMESDDEVSGVGNSYTTQFRQYDPRLMRWKSLDPLMGKFPWMSPYVAFDNNPIYYTGCDIKSWTLS